MEDSNSQMKAEALQLCKMLSKLQYERMPFQGVEISKILQRIPFFSKYFDMKSQQFFNLCITSKLLQFKPNTDIYSLQSQRYVYVILEGHVKVTLRDEQTNKISSNQHYLGQFNVFGQTQILFEVKQRNQLISTQNQPLICMVIEEQSIMKTLKSGTIDFLKKSLKYLHANQYFDQLTEFQKQQLVQYLSFKSFCKMDHLVSAEIQMDSIIFIIYGRVSVVKNISVNKDQLSQMDSFGEYECYFKKPTQCNLIAQSTGGFYCLDYQAITNLNHKILNIINQKAIPYPNDEQLNFLHSIQKNLKKQQIKIIKKNKLFQRS